jgi:hypothetical protein
MHAMIEQGSPPETARDGAPRAALRSAIADQEAAEMRRRHAQEAEQYGRELVFAAERVFTEFGDADLAIVQHRAEAFKRSVVDHTSANPGLPDDLATRRLMRDKALEHVVAAKAEHKRLVADLNRAESMARQTKERVAAAAVEVIMAQAASEAAALQAIWHDVWWKFDRLSALADCCIRYEDRSLPIALPHDIIRLLQTMAAVDDRQFPDGRNHEAAGVAELWCRWFGALLTNSEAVADKTLNI